MKSLFRRYVALAAMAAWLIGPAHAENSKLVVSQAFQSLLYLPLYVALDDGLFAKEGLDVTKETAGSASAALSAVLSGSATFSLHGPEWAAIAASKGANVHIVANVVGAAAVWIAAAPDYKFTDIKGLKGETVVTGQMPTTSTSLFLKLLAENGMDPAKDVSMIPVPIGSEIGPFLAGKAKVAVMYEPGLDQAVAKGMKVVVGFPALYGPYAFSTIIAKGDADPATVVRFATGINHALRLIRKDPAAAVAIAQKEFPTLDPAVVEAATKRMITENIYPPDIEVTPDALKTSMAVQVALGNLSAQPVYDSFVATALIKQALAAN
jgi:NitT/TauT family transport system substrate-binding protein